MLAADAAGMRDAPAAAREARFAGSSVGQQEVALYQGAPETNRVRVPYLWLEFYLLGYLRGPSGVILALAEQLS